MNLRRVLLVSPIERANRLILGISLGICLGLLFLLGAVGSDPVSDVYAKRPSTYFTDASGMKAAYLVSQRFLPATERWQQRYELLLEGPGDAFSTLVLAGPSTPISPQEAEAVDEWIRQGGQLVLALDREWQFLKRRSPFSARKKDGSETKEQAAAGYLARHGIGLEPLAAPVDPTAEASESVDSGAELALNGARLVGPGIGPLVFEGERILAGAVTIGSGRLIVVPDKAAFSNERLRESSNLSWLVRTCAAWGDGRVAFDEYHHGFGVKRGFAELLFAFLATPWGWLCLQVTVAGLLYLLAYKRRFGGLRELPVVRRDSALETIQARAGLFEAARARRLSCDLNHRYLTLRVSQRMGYAVDLQDPRLRARLSGGQESLDRAVRNYARLSGGSRSLDEDLSEATFVALAREAGRILESINKARRWLGRRRPLAN